MPKLKPKHKIMTLREKLNKLKQIYRELTKLDQISCLLSWDQETYMPPLAAEVGPNNWPFWLKLFTIKVLRLSYLINYTKFTKIEMSCLSRTESL